MKKCENCQDEFKPYNTLQKYCSDPCRHKATYTPVKRKIFKFDCHICKKKFETTQKTAKFCSDKCRTKNQKKNYNYKSTFVRSNIECANCKKIFEKKQPNHKYCSQDCMKIANTENYIKKGQIQNVFSKGELYSDRIKKKHGIGLNFTCTNCQKKIKRQFINQKYCSEVCRNKYHIFHLRKSYTPIEYDKEKNCLICDKIFTTNQKLQLYCGKTCLKIGLKRQRDEYKVITNNKKKEELYAFRSKSSKYYTLLNDLRFYKEHDFEKWFENNYILFGIKEIIKINRWFPDVVARMYNGKIIRIELELMASNFINHGHDPNMCDLIICFVKRKTQEKIKGVPVISIFDTTFSHRGTNTSYSEENLKLSSFSKNLIDSFNEKIENFIDETDIIYPDEEFVMAQISRIKDMN